MLLLAGLPALAQEGSAPGAVPSARLDAAKATLDGIDAALTRTDLDDTKLRAEDDTTLQKLRAQVDPVALDIQAIIAELTPRVEAAKARLKQLGPAPDPKAPPEPTDITNERAAQEKLFTDLDATVKRAKLLATQSAQIVTTIGAMRRALFTRAVLAQSYSLLDPRLWVPFVSELPSDFRAINFLAQDWYHGVASKIQGWQLATVIATLLLIAVAYEPIHRLARRVTKRDAETVAPSRLRKVAAALWVALITALLPILAMLLIGMVLVWFDLVNTRLQPIAMGFVRAVLIVTVNMGLARGFLSPRRTNWRLPPVPDNVAVLLYTLIVGVSAVVGLTRLVDAVNDTISVGLPTAVAARGLLTAGATGMILLTMERLGLIADDPAARNTRPKLTGRDWSGPLRLLFWLLIAILVAALLTGYVAFAAFLVLQIAVVSGIGILFYMLLILTDEGIETSFQPNRLLGRAMTHTLGLRRDSLDLIGILLSGFIRVVLITIAILLILAPWRIESSDMLGTLQAAYFGFSIGDLTISPSSIAIAVVLFLAGIGITRALQRWLEIKFLPHTRLDTGLQNSIKTSLGYLGFLVAASIGLSELGLSFERLAIVAGALSVGIGFGLQSIVNNFVSGLILLWERAIRVGDWIVVGDEQGYVRRINVRSTEIETFDRASIIVPNSNLVSGVVKNWLRNDRVGRIRLPFTVGVGTDPEKVRDILIAAAKDHDTILSIPSPQVAFAALGEANMRLELLCFIDDVEMSQRVTSDLLFTIHKGFRGIGLCQPAAPPTVTSPALDKLDAWLSGKMAESQPRRAAND
jgi:small-conductance mechanosensitive channel